MQLIAVKTTSIVIGSVLLAFKGQHAQKLQYYLITGPKLGGGLVKATSAKSQNVTFLKPSFIENGAKIVQRRVVLLK